MTQRAEQLLISGAIAFLGVVAVGIKAVDGVVELRRRWGKQVMDTSTNGGIASR